jgi:hypothetical protein
MFFANGEGLITLTNINHQILQKYLSNIIILLSVCHTKNAIIAQPYALVLFFFGCLI